MKIKVIPNARKTEIVGLHGDALKIKVAAVPEDGKANAELCAFVARSLGIAKTRVTVVRGLTSREKKLEIEGIPDEEALAQLVSLTAG